MNMLLRCLPLLALVPLSACGDDDGGSSTPAAPFESTTQTDDTRTAATMTPAEQTAFCEELKRYFESEISAATFKRMSCYFVAVAFSGGNAQACNQAAQGCIDDPESSFSSDEASCDTTRLTDCGATVAELEACYTDTVSTLKSFANRISCSSSASDFQGLQDQPASCQTVQTKCPNLFEDDGGGE